ncbi:MAG: hypothetical protein A2X86_21550 [Bdellovibrionales bacterium GWA2_49_15]|nr:MAG: hypothetical protein A2X86_21550 [Bdellovibrionales bacterium GWA2_49_15]HAZ14966.1 hypothetical protein [Bdellovibrionales bacterium]
MKIGHDYSCPKKIRKTLEAQQASINFLQSFVKSFPFHLSFKRLPTHEEKQKLINFLKIDFGLSMENKLALISLSKARYYAWLKKQTKKICLRDLPSCPKSRPLQLTFAEIQDIRTLLHDPELQEMSLTSLYWYGRRNGKANYSLTTWFKYIKRHNMITEIPKRKWSRPKKQGIRASEPNQIWHIDVTQIRLEDRSRVYIQAIIDNCSRYILAWSVFTSISGNQTQGLIKEAYANSSINGACRLISDSGTENLNENVATYLPQTSLQHEVAQVDIDYSNSMIEAFFRSLKQYSLYKCPLPNFAEAQAKINNFFERYNTQIPRHGLHGLTPFELHAGEISLSQWKSKLAEQHLDFASRRKTINKNFCLFNC